MEKNTQPLIIVAMVIGTILIVALALILTRNGDDTTTETANTNDTTNTQKDTSTEENGEDDQPQPTPDPIPEPGPEPSNGLPSNWQSLTSQQKTDLNPFDCDLATQIIRGSDGSCQNKPPIVPQPQPPENTENTLPPNDLPPNPITADFVALIEPHLTDLAKSILPRAEYIEENDAIARGLCIDSGDCSRVSNSYYLKAERAQVIYKKDQPYFVTHSDLAVFIHEFTHALDYYRYNDEFQKESEIEEVRQALIDFRDNPPPDEYIGIPWRDECIYVEIGVVLSLNKWVSRYNFDVSEPSDSLPESVYTELYAETAILIKNIPPKLEEHYSKFFTNRQAIVDLVRAADNYDALIGTGYGTNGYRVGSCPTTT